MIKRINPIIIKKAIKYSVGIIAAIILNIFIFELLQGITALIYGFEKVEFLLSNLELYNVISFTSEKTVVVLFIVFFSPQLFSLVFSELVILLLLKKSKLFFSVLIVSNLALLLFLVGVFTMIVLTRSNQENDWSLFFYFSGANELIKNITLSVITLGITVYSIIRIYQLIKIGKRNEQING
ncbi:MAG: hypothetical protein M0P71_10475 [Melioribacteraceae bacterium]|nr:hypothetical protein [Melioribacteraceae bacterium]